MKILVLIHEFPPVGGGGGRAAQDICQGLTERGHEVTVLTAHLKGLPKKEVSGWDSRPALAVFATGSLPR